MNLMIKISKKPLRQIGDAYTRIQCEEKGTTRFVEKGKTTTLVLHTGPTKKPTPRSFRTLMRSIVQSARAYKCKKIVVDVSRLPMPEHSYGESWTYETIAENLLLAGYEYTRYKSKKSPSVLSEVLLVGADTKEARDGIKKGTIVAEAANLCRDIANTPGGDMTPELLANAALDAAADLPIKVTVLNEHEIEAEGMGALLAVGKGAKDKPRFIVMEYRGASQSGESSNKDASDSTPDKDHPVVFVGKGITFDTGGLQIKPGMAMYEMHMDMSGGAAVIAAVTAAARLDIKRDIIGLIPSAENAVSGESIRPGDVVTTASGKTVDVLHTDAEGRLVLADALHYARQFGPSLVIDVATLTGAALVALGRHASAVMTKDRKLEDALRDLGEQSGDYVAPLPLWDEYMQYTKGVHGDVSNIPAGDSRDGGAINGGAFLANFAKGLRWAHIDMAPRMTAVPSDKLTKGATGEPTRLLVHISENL